MSDQPAVRVAPWLRYVAEQQERELTEEHAWVYRLNIEEDGVAKLPEGWVSLSVRLPGDLAERLKAEAKGRRLAVDSLVAYYAKEGLERDDLKPDAVDKLRRRHGDVMELHRDVDGECWECRGPHPCATYLVLTEDLGEDGSAKGPAR